jgi:aryl-alcohol dehydrogenase-like predicted oxidoreductase
MKTRLLGEKGFEVGEIGLGCWQLGADWGPSLEEGTAFAILSAAVENGITFFDTANVYGSGRSEKLIGQFIQECGKPVVVATKFGRGEDVYPDNYSEDALRRSVDAALKRLGVDALDLLQLHCIPTDALREGEVFDWLRRLKQEGAIRHFGASVETVEEGLLCLEQEGLLSLQVIFNVFRQKLVSQLLPQAKAQGVGIIVRLPLASGLLTGKFTRDTKFPETDHRLYNRDGQHFNVGETFAGLPFEKGVELVDMLKEMLPDGISMVQMALRWILDHDAVSVIIPGASSPEQAKANAEVSDLKPLSRDLSQALAEFYAKSVHRHIRGPY